jgi:hypothetical protein
MVNFSRLQCFQRGAVLLKLDAFTHTHWWSKKQRGQFKTRVQVQWDSSTDQMRITEGEVASEQ